MDLNESGSTAVACVLVGGQLWCANTGDCRAVLCRDGVAIEMSQDHKPDRPDEWAAKQILSECQRFRIMFFVLSFFYSQNAFARLQRIRDNHGQVTRNRVGEINKNYVFFRT